MIVSIALNISIVCTDQFCNGYFLQLFLNVIPICNQFCFGLACHHKTCTIVSICIKSNKIWISACVLYFYFNKFVMGFFCANIFINL